MELETAFYISVGVLSGACAFLIAGVIVLCVQVSGLKRSIDDLQNTNRLRVQKLKLEPDKNHAFHNPTLSPDEELSRRGYSMYMGSETDLESGRGTTERERQTGEHFLGELTKEIDNRQQKGSTAPPFLLQAIEENKRKSRSLANPVASHGRGRASETNPNFIY